MNPEIKEALLRSKYHSSKLLNATKCHEALCLYIDIKNIDKEFDDLSARYDTLSDSAAKISVELIEDRKILEAAEKYFGPLIWEIFVEDFNENRNTVR